MPPDILVCQFLIVFFSDPNSVQGGTSQNTETFNSFKITGITVSGTYDRINATVTAGNPSGLCPVTPTIMESDPSPVTEINFASGLDPGCEYTIELVSQCDGSGGASTAPATSVTHCTCEFILPNYHSFQKFPSKVNLFFKPK